MRQSYRSYSLKAGLDKSQKSLTCDQWPEGYFREPVGGDYVYHGLEQLRRFMAQLLGLGGIPLEHCTVTDDGVACAIEFNAVQFGPHPLVPQAGVAVYERGPSGRLCGARIYDDVNVEAYASSGGPADD